MKKYILTVLLLSVFLGSVFAQRVENGSVVYGNEWIDYDKIYYKIRVSEDGMYKVSASELSEIGFPITETDMHNYQLIHLGKEVPIFTSTSDVATDDDFFVFQGAKNRGEVDRYAYEKDEYMLNPQYSLISDTSAYFLTIKQGSSLRYNYREEDLADNNLTPEEYFLYTQSDVYSQTLNKPSNFQSVNYSNLVNTEGYASTRATIVNKTVALRNISDVGPSGRASIKGGTNFGLGGVGRHDIKLTLNDDVIYSNDAFLGFNILDIEYDIPHSDLAQDMNFSLIGSETGDNNMISIIDITYPSKTIVQSEEYFVFQLEPSSNARYYEIGGTSGEVIIINTRSQEMVKGEVVSDNVYGFVAPSSSTADTYIVYNQTKSVDSMKGEIIFTDFSVDQGNYVMLSNPTMYGNSNIINDYAAYRGSSAGGSYKTSIVDVRELYDQFGYGIDGHFVAVKHFGLYIHKHWDEVSNMFIIGKGIQYSQNRSGSADFKSYVPTFGSPGSDNLLFAEFGSNTPLFPVGRIAAKSAEEVEWYLDKVKGHAENLENSQTIEDRYWMKKVVHLSGGSSDDFQSVSNNLTQMEQVLEDSRIGSDVTTFYKYKNNTSEESFSNQVLSLINSGLSILTFFGHAAVETTDFNIAGPEYFDNKGKYPLVISLGCYSGNCSSNGVGISENYVLIKDKGAIAFLATSGAAYGSQLTVFGRTFYGSYGGENHGNSLGKTVHESLAKLDTLDEIYRESFVQQLVLHGDPAVKLHYSPGPDYISDYSTMTTIPKQINTFNESFQVCLDVVNIGSYLPEELLEINLVHYKPDGTISVDTTTAVAVPSARQNFCFTLEGMDRSFTGSNKIEIRLNPENGTNELPTPEALNNNTLAATGGFNGYEFQILSNNAEASYPYNYSIVNNKEVDLIATTYNAFEQPSSYIYELDTVPSFDSNYKRSIKIEEASSPIKWNVTLDDEIEKVYYWRVSIDSIQDGESINPVWSESSFVYAPESSEGWNQSHWGQYDDDELDQVVLDDSKNFVFAKWFREFRVENEISGDLLFTRAGALIDRWRKQIPKGFGIIVVDNTSGFMTRNAKTGEFDSEVSSANTFIHEYRITTAIDRKKFYDALQSDFFRDKTIIVMSLQREGQLLDINSWTEEDQLEGQTFNNVLENIGSSLSENIYNYIHPNFVLFIDGNTNEVAYEVVEDTHLVVGSEVIVTKYFEGEFLTVETGPAKSFESLTIDIDDNTYQEGVDSLRVQIIGITNNGEEEVLSEYRYTQVMDLSFINTDIIKKIKVKFFIYDITNHSPVNIEKIRISYIPFPDILLKKSEDFESNKTVNAGEMLSIPVIFENVSNTDINSLFDLTYLIKDEKNNEESKTLSFESLGMGTSKNISLEIETKGKSGDFTLEVEVNKSRVTNESKYSNNLGLINFEIVEDNIDPNLDVTFDGISIMENDIVSSKPKILIQLSDDNSFLLLDDSLKYEVKITYPDNKVISYTNTDPEINFIPAESIDENSAEIEFSPEFLIDGTYTLSVVGRDISGNTAGDNPYVISFRVINEEMVSQVFNYPNPFSTSTQFIFTLTGSTPPESMLVRIYTISGKVVKEITSDELGQLNIGINRTQYKWDGTDEYGDQLANGVYLYRVIAKGNNNDDYKIFKDNLNLDRYFNNGFGKLVIMR